MWTISQMLIKEGSTQFQNKWEFQYYDFCKGNGISLKIAIQKWGHCCLRIDILQKYIYGALSGVSLCYLSSPYRAFHIPFSLQTVPPNLISSVYTSLLCNIRVCKQLTPLNKLNKHMINVTLIWACDNHGFLPIIHESTVLRHQLWPSCPGPWLVGVSSTVLIIHVLSPLQNMHV